MSEQPTGLREDLWTFPCDHALKAMGLAHHPLIEIITGIVRIEVPDFVPADAKTLPSRTGKYHSITVTVRIERREQLENIYRALAACEEISWTL